MNELEFIKQLETKGITLTPQQVNQFKQYFKILVEWNEKMNLTAITDEEGVYLKAMQPGPEMQPPSQHMTSSMLFSQPLAP